MCEQGKWHTGTNSILGSMESIKQAWSMRIMPFIPVVPTIMPNSSHAFGQTVVICQYQSRDTM